MNKKTTGSLIVLVAMVIVAVVLWRLYLAGPPTVGPAPVSTSKPLVSPPPVEPQGPGPQGLPGVPPSKPGSAPGIAPLQEPSPPAVKITIPPPPLQKEHYGILVDTYRQYRDAAKRLGGLKKQGRPAFVQRDPRDLNRFQVWLGPFASQDEAQAAGKALRGRLKKPLKIEEIENPVPK